MLTNQRDPKSDPKLIKRSSFYSDSFFKDKNYKNKLSFLVNSDNGISVNSVINKDKENLSVKNNNKNEFNKFKNFILNRDRILKAKEVHFYAKIIFPIGKYKIKRIEKPLFKYIRISISNEIPNNAIIKGIQILANKLEAKYREQSLNRRPDLEARSCNGENPLSSVMTLNINGIKSKYNELMLLLQQRKPDIICLQETKKLVTDKRIHINGYLIHEVPASGIGLGLVMGFRKDSGLSCNVIESHDDIIISSIKGMNSNIIVGNVYRSPNPIKMKETTLRVVDNLNKYSNNNCLLTGDWNEIPRVLTKKLLKKGIQVYTNDAPTKGTRLYQNRKRTKRPIDYGLSNNHHMIASQQCRYNWMISDHLPVEVKINVSHTETSVQMTTIFDRKKLYEPKIVETIKNLSVDSSLDPIMRIKKFHENLDLTLKNLKVIRVEKRRENKIFIPNSIKKAIELKRQTDKKVRNGQATLAELRDARKSVKNAIIISKRKSYIRFIKKGIEYLKNNDSRNSWKWIKTHSNRTRNKLSVGLVYKPNTQTVETSPEERLKIWANHFRELSKSGHVIPEIEEIIETNNEISLITDRPISWSEVSSVLKEMRKGKAAGNDMIPGEVYKLVENEITDSSQFSKSILKLLNDIYLNGINDNGFPLEWRDCTVVPIYKKGDHLDPNNYRGIALINTLLKVLTKILAARLQTVCTSFNLLKREQIGFIKNEEGVSQAACLLECCQRRKIKKENTILGFLDLKKAYDMVPHNKLFYKLKKFGLGNKMIDFIKRMYDNTYMRVRVNDKLTEPFRYERGVRQGCPTSPLLFNIYINDILDDINPVEIPGLHNGLRGLMYADDTVIVAKTFSDLSEKLESINRWMINNAMELNPSKCGIMEIKIFPDQIPIEPLLFNGEEIPKVKKYIYLGIEFNDTLDINMMSKYRVDKGKQTLCGMIPTLRNTRVPLEYKCMLLKSILIPTIHYGSEIFGMNEQRVNSLKRILDNGIKCIVKKSNFCRLRSYDEFDIKALYVSAAVSRARGLKKWTNANGLISDCITSQSNFKSKESTWIKEAKRWLKVMGIDINLPLQELIMQVYTKRNTRLHERDRSVIGEFAKRLSLNSGKTIRRSEIKNLSNHKGVSMITKIRTGTFMFTKQLIRMSVLPTSLRDRCVCCNDPVEENPEHLILHCSKFNEIREKVFPNLRDQLQKLNTEGDQNKFFRKLLGEEGLTSGRKITREVQNTIEYLSCILPKRSAIITERKGDM